MVISILQTQIFVLVFTRVLMIMLALPFLGGSLVPNQVKIGFGFILTMFVFPWQNSYPASADAIGLIPFVEAVIQELFIGFLAGMSVTMVFSCFQIAAKMMEMSAGFSSAQIFNPTLNDTGSAYDQFIMIMIYLVFFAIDGHHVFLIGLQKTFQVMPVNSPLSKLMILTPDRLLQLFVTMMGNGIQMALPVVGAILLTDITLGLLNKVAPQVQVFFLGINIKVLFGLFGVSLVLSYMMPMIRSMIGNINVLMVRLLGA
jgi:flagellar biosynthesis protein FliR